MSVVALTLRSRHVRRGRDRVIRSGCHESVRAKYGALGHTVHRDVDKPNDLTIFNRFGSRARAEEFAHDSSLPEATQRGGVVGEPCIAWAEEADGAPYADRRAA